MEIIKRTNILVKTARRFVVHQKRATKSVQCSQCAGEMILAHESADFFGVSSRVIYRFIEEESVHFLETETNEIYVCPVSVRKALGI